MEKHEMAEKLVEKCGISYEEAAQVLNEANYDLLEAMIILERRGELGSEPKYKYSTGIMQNYSATNTGEKSAADAESIGELIKIAWKKMCYCFKDLLRYQVVVARNGADQLTFPMILAIILICVTAGTAFAVVIISLICGCNYTIRKN